MRREHHGRARAPVHVATVVLILAASFVVLGQPDPAGAVIAGTRVDPADHPAVVRLAEACTATLIAPRRLLTAGHCISRVVPGRTRVRVGGVPLRIVRIARHPRFPQ